MFGVRRKKILAEHIELKPWRTLMTSESLGTQEVIPGSQLSEKAKESTAKNKEHEGGSRKPTPETKDENWEEEWVQPLTRLYLVDLPIVNNHQIIQNRWNYSSDGRSGRTWRRAIADSILALAFFLEVFSELQGPKKEASQKITVLLGCKAVDFLNTNTAVTLWSSEIEKVRVWGDGSAGKLLNLRPMV